MNGNDLNEQRIIPTDQPLNSARRKSWHAPKLTVKDIQSTEVAGLSFTDSPVQTS
jgi:hypothetical protein